MITTTKDPMTGTEVTDLARAPFVIEGHGENALKIYFETEESRREYLDISCELAPSTAVEAYNRIAANDIMGGMN